MRNLRLLPNLMNRPIGWSRSLASGRSLRRHWLHRSVMPLPLHMPATLPRGLDWFRDRLRPAENRGLAGLRDAETNIYAKIWFMALGRRFRSWRAVRQISVDGSRIF